MKRFFQIVILVTITWLLANCAATPEFNLDAVQKRVAPSAVVENIEQYRNKKVLWGGTIINSTNLKTGTQFEILVYPLGSNFKPRTNEKALGRVIAKHDAYLETVDYAPGRLLTVVGLITDTKKGVIGEAEYIYPVVKVEQIHLWSEQDSEGVDTRLHFGVGVIIH